MTAHPSTRSYWLTGGALLILLVLSILTALVNLGEASTIVALVIAAIKVSIVAALFMHLKLSSTLTKVFAGAGLFWLLILIGLTFNDYFTRMPP